MNTTKINVNNTVPKFSIFFGVVFIIVGISIAASAKPNLEEKDE